MEIAATKRGRGRNTNKNERHRGWGWSQEHNQDDRGPQCKRDNYDTYIPVKKRRAHILWEAYDCHLINLPGPREIHLDAYKSKYHLNTITNTRL